MSFEEEDPESSGDSRSGNLLPEFVTDPVGVFKRRWMVMAACLALSLVGTVIALISWTPTFRSSATVLITGQQIPTEYVRSTVQTDDLDNVNAMVGQVTSTTNLSQIIDEFELFSDAKSNVPRIDLIQRMRERISAGPQASRNRRRDAALIYEIAYESEDPAETAQVANALAALFVEASISRRNAQAQRTTGFMKGELERDERELREQSRLVSEFRRAHRGELPDELTTNLRKVDLLSARRESLGAQISEKENRILVLTSQRGDAPLSESEILLGELRRELARETAVNTDEHPNVIALRDRIRRLEASTDGAPVMPAAQRAIVQAERRDIARMRDLIVDIETELADLNGRIDRTPGVAEQLTALEQKEHVLREDYLDALRKVEEAELAESLESAQQGGQVSILDAAQRPTRPTKSRRGIALRGLLLSIVFPLGIAGLLELVDPVIVSGRQVVGLSGRPVLGSLPDVV